MTFNTLRNDSETQARMKTYAAVMGQFSRFQIQVIAKCNNVPFTWGVTPKEMIIQLMQSENVMVPRAEDWAEYLKKHKAGEAAETAEKEAVAELPLEELKRQELIKLAHQGKIENPMKLKNIELIEALRGAKPSISDE